jgi:primosomal protein N' (replication factor Y)
VPVTLLELSVWTAAYYLSPPGLLLRLTLPPPGARLKGPRFSLTDTGRMERDSGAGPCADLLLALARGPRTSRYLTERFDSAILEKALGLGFIAPLPAKGLSSQATAALYTRREDAVSTLTKDQANALSAIKDATLTNSFKAFYLKGVTGSGKTEVYLRSARKVLDQGKSVLLLVPEISLTPLLISRLEHMSPGEVVSLHSGLPTAARTANWEAVRSGKARVVVGVRSGVFAPIPDLGLIVIDEEHDPSFRQEETPCYNARDVAVKRAQMEGVPIILGSATPSLESWLNAKKGRYTSLFLPKRVTPSPSPDLVLVDMSEHGQVVHDHPMISRVLVSELKDILQKGEQAILFLNRRGYSPFLLCTGCRHTVLCPNCSVTLTYHSGKELVCHYCGQKETPPASCPSCGVRTIKPVGSGTQRIEKVLAELFPDAVVDRLDRDALTKHGALESVYENMDSGYTRILVGTQMLAKGHDFPGVTLAGILNAEQALDLPDFRSAERTFQIITQVAGRAGRGSRSGKVIIQTWSPEHYAVQAALRGDDGFFYRKEMSFRKELGYPPCRRLGRILIDGISEEKVIRASLGIAGKIQLSGGLKILGPSPAPILKIRNRYRWHILVLADSHSRLIRVLSAATAERRPGVRITSRVDPVQLM